MFDSFVSWFNTGWNDGVVFMGIFALICFVANLVLNKQDSSN